MGTLRFRSYLIAVLVGGAALSCCAPTERPVLKPDTSQAQRYFLVGDFEEAIASYAAIAEQYPGHESVLVEYTEMLESIKSKADQAFDSGDYGDAEKIYSLLSANFPGFTALEITLSFEPPFLSRRILECRVRLSERRARQSLAAGDYQNALASYKGLPREIFRESRVSSGLKRIMEEIKRLADTAVARKDFLAAGKGYAALWNDYPLVGQAGVSLSFPREVLEEGIKNCRTQLTKEGLDQYRKGRLKEAIEIWQGLLEFDPENAEIKKAVDTASEQLKKLKKE